MYIYILVCIFGAFNFPSAVRAQSWEGWVTFLLPATPASNKSQ